MKHFFTIKNAKGETENLYYEMCDGKSAKVKVVNNFTNQVWYFTNGWAYNFLTQYIVNVLSKLTGNAGKVRENIDIYHKDGNRWNKVVEGATNFFDIVERDYNIIVK